MPCRVGDQGRSGEKMYSDARRWHGRAQKRFSLLMLEEGEDYVRDALGTCTPPPEAFERGNWTGFAAPVRRTPFTSLFFTLTY